MKFPSVIKHLFHPQKSNRHRPRILHHDAYFLMAGIVIVGVWLIGELTTNSQFGNVLGYASSITPTKVLQQTNDERASTGLPPLQNNPVLAQAAISKAQHMFSNQYWAHDAPDGTTPWVFIRNSGYRYRVAGENLARDFLHTDSMVSAWMNSPTHRANIMNSQYKEIGIAVVDGILEGEETTLVVQMFGTQLANVAQEQIPDSAAGTEEISRTVTLGASEEEVETAQISTVSLAQANEEGSTPQIKPNVPEVAGQLNLSLTDISSPPLFSPLHLIKAFFIGVILMIVSTLVYDAVVVDDLRTIRLVGKNMAHIMLFMTVIFLILFFQGGIIA